MQIPVCNLAGEVVKNIEVSDRVFGVPFNESVVHQAMVRQLADARQGTASTKHRGEVAGSGKKLYAQKHTGRARAGDARSPTRRHGGVVFGPRPRSYAQDMPKKMRQLALRCLLSNKVRDGELKVVEDLTFAEPKTKEMENVLVALGLDATVLIALAKPETNVIKSARNIPGVKTLPANLMNTVDILSHKALLMNEAAVRKAEELWGEKSGTL